PDMCRPFSATRNGMVQGEGAAVFVFEDMDRARARGARVLAEVAGFGMTSDAEDIVRPSQVGAERAMRAALQDAGLRSGDVGYINAHGTGTKLNDSTESAAIRAVFDSPPPVSSTKAMHGHLMGATGAVELLAVIMALRDGYVAPTVGFEAVDPECALDVVPNVGRHVVVDVALSNAFAFGGLNAVLALRRA
ncbi:MAG: beta-ACP synthase, partial [Paracoccaceae bacterium]